MTNKYWEIVAEEIIGELNITLSDEALKWMAKSLEGAHENYSLYTGEEVVEKNWRACKDREIKEKGEREALRYVERLVDKVFSGAGNIFPLLDHDAKIAMHKLNNVKEFYKSEGFK